MNLGPEYPVLDGEGRIENFTIRLKDTQKFASCPGHCGANVFYKPYRHRPTLYRCPSCRVLFEAV